MASPVIGPMVMAAFLSPGEIGAEVGGGTDGGYWERGYRALDRVEGRQRFLRMLFLTFPTIFVKLFVEKFDFSIK